VSCRKRAFALLGVATAAILAIVPVACSGGNGSDVTPAPATIASPAATRPVTVTEHAQTNPSPQPTRPLTTQPAATPAAGVANVTLVDYEIQPDVATVPAGDVTFTVNNAGSAYHSLLIIKTDLPPSALPQDDDGSVDETDDNLDIVDEIFGLLPGEGDSITTQLDPGAYVLICNVVDDDGTAHYASGMRTAFQVTP